MYNFYNHTPEERTTWRNAYEIKMAALQHEKRRFQAMDDSFSLAKPHAKNKRRSRWNVIFKMPMRLLAILFG